MSSLSRLLAATAILILGSATTARAVKCPNIMFVLDQSGSMSEDPNGGNTVPSKWTLLQQAVASVLKAFGDQAPFGVELFTSLGVDNASCYSDTKIAVEPAHNTAMQIENIVNTAMPDSGTNTGEAIKRARVDPAMMDASRGQYIILITDGDPNCNTGDLAGNAMYTVSEIKNAYNQSPSIHTFVIGFDGSGGVNPANLNAMAVAGGEPMMGGTKQYFSASNAQSLDDALNMILNMVTGGGEFGMGACDDSCYSNGCDPGYVCTTTEQSTGPTCVPDPCAGVGPCPMGSYCRAGACVSSCPKCPQGQLCQDGNCVGDPCAGVSCMGSQICDPSSGGCINNLCGNVTCKAPTACDPSTGLCADDPCHLVTCPMGTACMPGGNCEATGGPTGPGTTGHRATGCTISSPGGNAAGLGLSLLALLGIALVTRKRRG
jgi:hypothetical protein